MTPSGPPMRFVLRPLLLPAVIALAAILSARAGAEAQTLVGSVVEAGTGQPLAGAFLRLEDVEGARQGGVLSGPDGRFVLRPPAPGTYRLVVELIGYAGTRTEPFEVRAGETVHRDLEVPVRAVSLGGITAGVEERCRRRPGSGPATATLWEEARKALEVTRWAESQEVLRFRIVEHRRDLDASSLEVLAQERTGRSGYWGHSPYQSVPAGELLRRGYIQQADDGTWDYFAPDADVLLSESFLDAHCFRAAGPKRDEPGLVGLAFEPVPERELPDLEGVLWLDRGSAELRRLDFTYTNLPFPHGDWPQVGGRVEFERLATGMWIVRRWYLRMPIGATRRHGPGAPLELVRLHQQGAEVRSVRTRDGTLLAEASGATLFGTVTGPEGAPMAGATVELVAAGRRTRTGDDGAYRLTGLPEGRWAVRATHPAIERAGALPAEASVRLEAGRATRAGLALSLSPEAAARACAAAGWPMASRAPVLLYGRVEDAATGAGLADVPVRVTVAGRERRLLSDSAGVYRVCLEPSDSPVEIVAERPGPALREPDGLPRATASIREPGFVRADLSLPGPGAAGSGEPGPGTADALVGRVLEEDEETPVAGALVELRSEGGELLASRVTGGDGAFRIPHPGAGERFDLRVERVGHAPVEGGIRFPKGERVRVDVLVARRPIVLDPIVVRERRRGPLVDVGFYDRREAGRGVFVDRAEIEDRRPTRVTDLLRGRAGLRVVDAGIQGADLRLVRQVDFRRPDDCQPAVWIDGALAREGGPVQSENGVIRRVLTSLIQPENVEAMEVYTGAAGLPPRFGGSGAMCGVVVIWTRRPGPPGG